MQYIILGQVHVGTMNIEHQGPPASGNNPSMNLLI